MTEQNYSNVPSERIEHAGRHAYIKAETDAKLTEEQRIIAAAKAAAKLTGQARWLMLQTIADELHDIDSPLYQQFSTPLGRPPHNNYYTDRFAEWLSSDQPEGVLYPVDLHCSMCGSTLLSFTTSSTWDPVKQRLDVYETEKDWCNDCDQEADAIELPIDETVARI